MFVIGRSKKEMFYTKQNYQTSWVIFDDQLGNRLITLIFKLNLLT